MRKSEERLELNKKIVKEEKCCHLYPRKDHFQNLLSVIKNDDKDPFDCVKSFDKNPEISTVKLSERNPRFIRGNET